MHIASADFDSSSLDNLKSRAKATMTYFVPIKLNLSKTFFLKCNLPEIGATPFSNTSIKPFGKHFW